VVEVETGVDEDGGAENVVVDITAGLVGIRREVKSAV